MEGGRPSSLASPPVFRLWRQSCLLSPALLLSLVYTSAFSPAPLAPEGAESLGALFLGSWPHVASDPPPCMEQALFCPPSETSLLLPGYRVHQLFVMFSVAFVSGSNRFSLFPNFSDKFCKSQGPRVLTMRSMEGLLTKGRLTEFWAG